MWAENDDLAPTKPSAGRAKIIDQPYRQELQRQEPKVGMGNGGSCFQGHVQLHGMFQRP